MIKILNKIKRLLINVYIDFKFGHKFLGGSIPSKYESAGAHGTSNTEYQILSILFNKILYTKKDVFVDVGCGKGRVINWWLSRNINSKIVGIELDKSIAEKTAARLKKYNNVVIVCGDAVKNTPSDGTIFYMYNPFNEAIMLRFAAGLIELKKKVSIIYYNPVYCNVFSNNSAWQVDFYDSAGSEELLKAATYVPLVHSFAIITTAKQTI